VVKVTGNGVPGAVGQGRSALLPGLQVARVVGIALAGSIAAHGALTHRSVLLSLLPLAQ
jgi:hypothetical protein